MLNDVVQKKEECAPNFVVVTPPKGQIKDLICFFLSLRQELFKSKYSKHIHAYCIRSEHFGAVASGNNFLLNKEKDFNPSYVRSGTP